MTEFSRPDPVESAGLSIGRLAEETGVAPGTLRMWEARHGFPTPLRGEGRHRRYSAEDTARIKQVVADRDRGLSLPAAIARARGWAPNAPRSLFATVRAQQPQLETRRLPVHAMTALSHAVEDECLARADRPILAASFQTAAAYRTAERRWRELARTARLAFVLADFRRARRPRRGPLEVPLERDAPLRREWVVVCLDDHFAACLAGWEVPSGGGGRMFEMVWTTEPTTAVAAMTAAVAFAGDRLSDVSGAALRRFRDPPALDSEVTLRLANRMIGYLAQQA